MADIQKPKSEGDGVKSAQWSDVDRDAMELDSSSHIACRQSHLSSRFCKRISIEKECEVDTERCAKQSHHGTRHVNLGVEHRDSERTLISRMQTYLTANSEKLLRNGFVFSLKGENDSTMYHQSDPTTTVPVFLHMNSSRLRADPIVHHVSLAVEDGMPLRLSSRSAVEVAGSPFG